MFSSESKFLRFLFNTLSTQHLFLYRQHFGGPRQKIRILKKNDLIYHSFLGKKCWVFFQTINALYIDFIRR